MAKTEHKHDTTTRSRVVCLSGFHGLQAHVAGDNVARPGITQVKYMGGDAPIDEERTENGVSIGSMTLPLMLMLRMGLIFFSLHTMYNS